MEIDPTIKAIRDWSKNVKTSGNDQGKALLKRDEGKLKFINENELGFVKKYWNRFLRFFGWGNFALHNVIAVARQSLEKPSIEKNIIELLNEKIKKHNKNHPFQKQIAIIASNQLSTTTETARDQTTKEPSPVEIDSTISQTVPKNPSPHPFVGDRISTKDYVGKKEKKKEKHQLDPNYQTTVERLTQEIEGYSFFTDTFDIAEVRGEGHCMFRSIARALLSNPDDLLKKIQEAYESNNLEDNPIPKFAYQQVLQSILDVQSGQSIDEIVNKETVSNSWVQFLRFVSSNFWRYRGQTDYESTEVFRTNVMVDKMEKSEREGIEFEKAERIGWSLEEYLSNMCQMLPEGNVYGGHPELVALSHCLKIQIGILDVKASATQKTMQASTFVPSKDLAESNPTNKQEDLRKCEVLLFKEGEHYNTAFFHS